MDTMKKLGNLIKARHGVIAVRTNEMERVLDDLWRIANKKGNPRTTILTWSITEGVRKMQFVPSEDAKEKGEKGTIQRLPVKQFTPDENDNGGMNLPFLGGGMGDKYAAPPGAIQATMEYKPEFERETVVMVAFNYHHWLQEPQVQQLLLDAISLFLQQRRTFIMVGPSFDLPDELAKSIAILDFGLPSPDEIRAEVEELIGVAVGTGKFTADLEGGIQVLVRALQGMTALEVRHTINLAFATYRRLDTSNEMLRLILDRKKTIVKSTGALEFIETDATMDDVGGLEYFKRYAYEVAVSFTDEAKAFGAVPPRMITLIGPPGTGKSLVPKCFANLIGVPLLRLDMGAIFSSLVGSTEANLRRCQRVAEAVAPCILQIDEVEKGMGTGGGELDGGTSSRVLGSMLTWVQEVARDAGVLVINTANSVSKIDPAFLQRGDVFCVDLPDAQARKDILAIHLAKNGRPNWQELGINLDAIAEQTEGFSGRELEDIVLSAIRKAFRAISAGEHTGDVTDGFIVEAQSEIVPAVRTMWKELAEMRALAGIARPAGRPSTYNPLKEGKEITNPFGGAMTELVD